MWSPVVLAITISSSLFAIEDLYASLARSLASSCEIASGFISEAVQRATEDMRFFTRIDNAAIYYEGTDHDLTEVKKSFAPIKKKTQECLECITEIELQTAIKQRKTKQYQKIANVFAFFGFLLLFCILIFASHITIPTIAQEYITVFSFVVVLVTQQTNSVSSERIKKETEDSKNALAAQNVASDALGISQEKFNAIISLIEERETEMAGHEDAD